MKCKNCKKEIPDISVYCPECGYKTHKKLDNVFFNKKCKKCGLVINTEKLKYCPDCKIDLK